MTKNLFFSYFIFIHLLLGIILIKSDFIYRTMEKISYGKYSPEPSRHFKTMLMYHKRMDKQVPKGSVIFIGDSITQALAVNAVAVNAVNYGIAADTTLGVLKRIDYYASLAHASVIVLAIGVNDLERRADKDIIDNYNKILDKLPNNVPILVSAIHPIDEEIRRTPIYNNERIEILNNQLERICTSKENKKITFLNISKKFLNSKHSLNRKYHVGDGIHLSLEAYKIWIDELKQALDKIF
jgi:lysophospholipase L1-like esterase